ncbi:MAG: hypothetical protein JRH07_01095 [Deltaproteobacteria bacterium]|nr:hypothetical protein [Deltaproteobacteria bacterium]MBW2120428.1 hypothetical protein [Deltaproteobacteria bacterium]
MRLRVECYSGYKVNERPLAFYMGEKRLNVRELLDQWHGEDHDYFKLRADDGNTYILKYQRFRDYWELVFFSAPDVPGSFFVPS